MVYLKPNMNKRGRHYWIVDLFDKQGFHSKQPMRQQDGCNEEFWKKILKPCTRNCTNLVYTIITGISTNLNNITKRFGEGSIFMVVFGEENYEQFINHEWGKNILKSGGFFKNWTTSVCGSI